MEIKLKKFAQFDRWAESSITNELKIILFIYLNKFFNNHYLLLNKIKIKYI